jgi:hypothetical protein
MFVIESMILSNVTVVYNYQENIEWIKLATGFSELYEAEERRDEYRQQLKLIRDRLSNCSSGVVEACDIFGEQLPPGVVSVSCLNRLNS